MQVSASAHTSLEPAPPPGFTELYAEHYDFLWRCALRMGTPAADLEDIVQECFVVALRRFPNFDPRGRALPSTWLFGILRNVQRNHARASRRRTARLELLAQTAAVELGDEQAATRSAEASLAGRLLDDFLATLDDDKRAAFVLAEIEGMTGPEIADALELNLNTTNSRVRAARQAFARCFDDAKPRRIVEAEVERLAGVRAPIAVRRRGLPMIAMLAGSESMRASSLGGTASGIASKLTSKLIASLLFGSSVIAAAAIVADGRPEQAPAPVIAAQATTAPARSTSAEPSAAPPRPEPEQALTPPPAAIDQATESRPPALQRPKLTPLQRIATARTALQDQAPARALDLLEHQPFPAEFDHHRIALEVAALCQLDREADAESRARAWRSAHPDHRTAAELIGLCWSE